MKNKLKFFLYSKIFTFTFLILQSSASQDQVNLIEDSREISGKAYEAAGKKRNEASLESDPERKRVLLMQADQIDEQSKAHASNANQLMKEKEEKK